MTSRRIVIIGFLAALGQACAQMPAGQENSAGTPAAGALEHKTAGSGFGQRSEATLAPEGRRAGRLEQTIRQALPATPIDSIRPSPVPGLLEVVAGRNILYASESGRYLVIGHIYDLKTARDVTAARKAELVRIGWDDLPLEAAVRYGTGPLKVAVFHDPDCPWCRKLHRELREAGDIEVFEIMYPVPTLHPGAKEKAVAILCHDNPAHASDLVVDGKVVDTPPPDCEAEASVAVERAMDFGRKHGVRGTPTLVAPDGRTHAGYLPVERLKSWLLEAEPEPNSGPGNGKEENA